MCRSLVTNTLKPCLLSGATVLITLRSVSAAHAVELAGVSFPDRATVRGRAAVLNGLGLRTATVLKVKVYVIGLYLENRSSDLQAIIASSDHKRIVMQFVRDTRAFLVQQVMPAVLVIAETLDRDTQMMANTREQGLEVVYIADAVPVQKQVDDTDDSATVPHGE